MTLDVDNYTAQCLLNAVAMELRTLAGGVLSPSMQQYQATLLRVRQDLNALLSAPSPCPHCGVYGAHACVEIQAARWAKEAVPCLPRNTWTVLW